MPTMRIAGHSCSTPHLGPLEAIDFYGKLGLDGIELSCDQNYRCAITHQAAPALRKELRSRAQAAGIVVACLAPFLRDLNVPDPSRRASTIETMRRYIDLAHELVCPAIGIIYDQGMLTYHNCEPFADAIQAQAKWIRHVHVKDHILSLNRRRVATVVGKGQLPWHQIVPALHRHGYGGFLSLEYETRWFPYVGEIPPPEIGLVEGARYLRELLSGLA